MFIVVGLTKMDFTRTFVSTFPGALFGTRRLQRTMWLLLFSTAAFVCSPSSAKPLISGQRMANTANGATADQVSEYEAFMQDCDWTGATKPSFLTEGSVQSVYLSCSAGRIKWLSPEGAVTVMIRAPFRRFSQYLPVDEKPTPHQGYNVCITANRRTIKGVNIYRQDKQKLQLLFTAQHTPRPGGLFTLEEASSTPTNPDRKCFMLPTPEVRLFLESFFDDDDNLIASSEPVDNPRVRTHIRLPRVGAAEIVYDIHPITS